MRAVLERFSWGSETERPDFRNPHGQGMIMGDRVQLRMAGNGIRHNARFLGCVPGRAMMFVLECQDTFKSGQEMVCTHFGEESFLLFNTKVEHFESASFPLLRLAYPANFQTLNSERNARFNLDNGAALLQAVSNSTMYERVTVGKVLNMGPSGALVSSRVLLGSLGDEIMMSLLLHGCNHSAKVRMSTMVRSMNQAVGSGGNARYYYDLGFDQVGQEDTLSLKTFVLDNLKLASLTADYR